MRPARWTTALLAIGLVTALVTGLPTAYAAGRAAAVKPSVGECRSLTIAEASAASDTSDPIPCSTAHTARVIAVPSLPSGVGYPDLDTAAKLDRVAVKLCYPAFRAALGQNDKVRDRSAYAYLYFVPTADQRDAGARWLRCDLTLRHGGRLADLPTDAVPALSGTRLPAKVKRCLAGTNLRTTVCTATHRYRSTGAFTVALERYPGRAALLRIGRKRCPALVSTDGDFRFTWAPKTLWNLVHDRTIVCYSHTSS
jgi:hypothetical protein